MRPCLGLLILLCTWTLAGSARAEATPILYMLECQGCHLADGAGAAGKVPALKGFVGRFLTVAGGREYLVQVPGSAQSRLDDAELASVLNWIVGRFGPEAIAANFVPFTAQEVARYRGRPLTDVEAVRRELMRRMSGTEASREP